MIFDFDPKGFEWMDCNDWENSILTFVRKGTDPDDIVLVAMNFTPVPRDKYKVGVPIAGFGRKFSTVMRKSMVEVVLVMRVVLSRSRYRCMKRNNR